MDARLRRHEAYAAALAHEAAHDERRRDALRYDRRNSDARDVEVQIDDEEEVQHDVDDPGDREIEERTARVPDRAQHGAAEVVYHHRRHAEEIYDEVERREAEHLGGRLHDYQDFAREDDADERQENPARDGEEHRSVHRLGERLLLLRAVVARGEDVRPYRDADEEVRQQPYERRVRADRRERVVPRVASDDDDVRGVEEQLQNARKHQRHGEEQHLWQDGAAAHIYLKVFIAGAVRVYRPYSENVHKPIPACNKICAPRVRGVSFPF